MKHYSQLAVALACLIQLAGCSYLFGGDGYFRDREDDYLKAKSTDAITLPAEMDSSVIVDLYVVPRASARSVVTDEFKVPRPAPLLSERGEEMVRIQKLGTQQWILVSVSPSQLWPQVRHFLFAQKIRLGREDGNSGIVETDWMTLAGNVLRREKFQFKIVQGVQRNSAEIHVREIHDSVGGGLSANSHWPASSMDFSRESWMVEELAQFLAGSIGRASVSLLAQGISTASKLAVVKGDDGNMLIRLQLPYERAWASVGHALQKAEFRIDDRDRSRGEYRVSYRPAPTEDDMPGFWGRLFGRDTPEYADVEYAGEEYQVSVKELEQGAEIRFIKPGKTLTANESERLISLIKGYLT